MRRILLTVAYDGTNYHGWQVQDNGDTIEGELNKAILKNDINFLSKSNKFPLIKL